MDRVTMRARIAAAFADTYTGQVPDTPAPTLGDQDVLLQTGLDSLGFAILVVRLEDDLGFDPFAAATDAYYPRTFGALVDFYHENQPR